MMMPNQSMSGSRGSHYNDITQQTRCRQGRDPPFCCMPDALGPPCLTPNVGRKRPGETSLASKSISRRAAGPSGNPHRDFAWSLPLADEDESEGVAKRRAGGSHNAGAGAAWGKGVHSE